MIKQQIIRRFNVGAKTYQSAVDIQLVAAQRLSAYLKKTASRILEIGCGTGLFSEYIVNRFKDKPILLTDISAEMLNITQAKFSTYPNVTTAWQDGEKLSSNSDYDLIVSNMVFHWFDNIKIGIQNIIDRVSSGGGCAFTLLGENSLREWRDICSKHNYTHSTLDFISIEELRAHFPFIQFTVEKYSINYASPQTFLRTLKNIGGTASYVNSRLSTSDLRRLLRKTYSSFPVTYEIIYGHYIKP